MILVVVGSADDFNFGTGNNSKAQNEKKTTLLDIKLLQRCNIESITTEELNEHVSHFIILVRPKYGKENKSSSLPSLLTNFPDIKNCSASINLSF